MSGEADPPQADFEEASSQLDQGLKSCRSLMRNYRAILGDRRDADPAEDARPEGRSTED